MRCAAGWHSRILAGGLALIWSLIAYQAHAQDTTKARTPLFLARDAGIAGLFALATVALFPADRDLARRIRQQPLQNNHLLHDAAAFFRFMGTPGSALVGTSMYAVGRLGRVDRLADLGLHGTESLALAAAVTALGKGLGGRARPLVDITSPQSFAFGRGFARGRDDYRSFPSGHAAMAFAAASAVTAETKRWWPRSVRYVGSVMYGGAALVGVSRMYDTKHWASDVVLGSAIGTFSGLKIVHYSHVNPDNVVNRRLLRRVARVPMVMPSADGFLVIWADR